MFRWSLFVLLAIFSVPFLPACEVSWGRTLQNPTVRSSNGRFSVVLRIHENVPDFGRRRTSLILRDPPPKWSDVPLAIYDRRRKISEFHIDFNIMDDALISDSGQYVVGILRTKDYPCAEPPRWPEDQIATIYRTDGTLIAAVRLKEVVPESDLSGYDPYAMPLQYSIRTERGGEVLVIRCGDRVTRRALLTPSGGKG